MFLDEKSASIYPVYLLISTTKKITDQIVSQMIQMMVPVERKKTYLRVHSFHDEQVRNSWRGRRREEKSEWEEK